MSDFDDDDFQRQIDLHVQKRRRQLEIDNGIEALSRVGSDLDTTMNFRVNSILKSEFESVCRLNHTSPSREIKRFMTEVIRTRNLI